MMARIRLTQEAMDDSDVVEASWKSAKKDEMTRIIDDIAKREEFALSCDGKGILCALTDATPSNDAAAHQRQEPRQHRERLVRQPLHAAGMYVAAVNPATGDSRRHREGRHATNDGVRLSAATRRRTRPGHRTTICAGGEQRA
jgi:hypothetical protein